ncbi:MAG: flavin reductase family protein [Actinomycetota bacterium]|jgi:flavin reductase (DIM6/NTAB) family NADH-FMN oxidoreductase RutF|nr:flavin reductase family protein [Actinomycetota bacterium]
MKKNINPSNISYPQPIALVTCCDAEGNDNIITIAWTSNASRVPPIVMISIGGEKYSYKLISQTKEFGLNIPDSSILEKADFCGENSGEEINKFEKAGFTKIDSNIIRPKLIQECPINYECKVVDMVKVGGGNIIFGEVVNCIIDDSILDDSGAVSVEKLDTFAYLNKGYFALGKCLAKRGFSNKQ